MAFNLFRRNSEENAPGEARREADERGAEGRALEGSAVRPAVEQSGARREHRAEELPTDNGLPELVALMDSYGVHTLQLNQHGNEMTAVMDPSEKPERKTTVDTESTWFDGVAKLYTEAQSSPRGPWRRAEIMIANPRQGQRAVEIEYTYPDSERQDRRAYVQTLPREERPAAEIPVQDAASGSAQDSVSGPASAADQASEGPSGGTTPGSGTASVAAMKAVSEDSEQRCGQEAPENPPTAGNASDTEGAGSQAAGSTQTAETPSQGTQTQSAQSQGASTQTAEAPAVGATGTGAVSTGVVVGVGAAEDTQAAGTQAVGAQASAAQPTTGQTAGTPESESASSSSEEIPSVIDEPDWEERPERPEADAPSDALPDTAPSTADHADVSPSYSGAPEAVTQPSTSRLAPGNLVLTEAEVVQLLTAAQSALFGPEGTARDVSTVLIRVRALGSYYDALTHVRRNGFWDQRPTFELIPEEALHVHELKSDSYQEGEGAPVAMMFRFTPGIPPQVSFSYEDEESFVKYKDRLPAQQYIEELRMFPRTGANIPEHMNDALTQWTL